MTIIASSSNGLARIGYENLFESATTITATDEETGYEKENAYNWNLFDWWKPASAGTKYLTATFSSAVIVDYFALFGHTLHTYSDSIQLQYSTNGSTWNDATDPQAPSTGRVLFVTFAAITAAWWRLKLITTGPCIIGAATFGQSLELPKGMKVGFIPPPFARNNKYSDKSTVKGVPLPRTIERMAGKITITQANVDPVWMRSNWAAFLDHAETQRWFFSWDSVNHSTEAAYCITKKDPNTKYSSTMYMDGTVNANILTVLDP